MPIPTPRANETRSQFISRCMDDDVMKREYPNQNQRAAVCNDAWDEKHAMLIQYLKSRGWSCAQIKAEIARIEGEH